MPFHKFVEVGRVVCLNYGKLSGKTAVILDMVDANRALIEGPHSGIPRQVIPIRRFNLTHFKIKDVLRNQRSGLLKKKIQKFDLDKQWAATPVAKKQQQKATRAKLTDFDRFKVMVLKKRLSKLLAQKVKKIKKDEKSQPKKEKKKAPPKKQAPKQEVKKEAKKDTKKDSKKK